jgi:hypothetical protein
MPLFDWGDSSLPCDNLYTSMRVTNGLRELGWFGEAT